ncbi:expressed protein [Phakopsora pachyrhizi]|uniref:Expressed protein n=1 Tax=Phakopsora pachyrhizi TaxID=170000 RepID=A0AAV0BBR3_PHAPC|nr:expressed protein [Phakopsora pachyrhizi]
MRCFILSAFLLVIIQAASASPIVERAEIQSSSEQTKEKFFGPGIPAAGLPIGGVPAFGPGAFGPGIGGIGGLGGGFGGLGGGFGGLGGGFGGLGGGFGGMGGGFGGMGELWAVVALAAWAVWEVLGASEALEGSVDSSKTTRPRKR